MPKPIAVLISDVHYSLSTLELADTAFTMAIDKAAELGVPLYDLGDITNDKANLRAEVMNKMIDTLEYAKRRKVQVTLLVGNHSLVNEKSKENALNFLHPYATIIADVAFIDGRLLIPYQASDLEAMGWLKSEGPGAVMFAHQGLTEALPGHYAMDHSAVHEKGIIYPITVFSGHYHNGQTIHLTRGGTWTYVGNPYTLTFGEANDTPKGFLVLMDDNSFERIPCNLRKHVVVERTVATAKDPIAGLNQHDLLWLKIRGNATDLATVDKDELGKIHLGHANYRFEKILNTQDKIEAPVLEQASKSDILFQLIRETSESEESKTELVELARKLLS